MPLSAMPDWIKDTAEGTNTDWNNPIQKHWRKSLFAFGPRAAEWWAKWREFPITLFAVRSKEGRFRTETETYERDSSRDDWNNNASFFMEKNIRLVFFGDHNKTKESREIVQGYLSAIQYWTKWHFQVSWPLQVAFHYYIDDVPCYPDHAPDKRVVYFRLGARRDADKVYWWPSLFVGLRWN